MSKKIYSLDEALEYVEEFNKDSDDVRNFLKPLDNRALPDGLMETDEMMQDFQKFVNEIMNELDDIVQNEKERLDNVEIEYEILAEFGGIVQIFFEGKYLNFIYDHVLVTPIKDWEMKQDEVIKWVKAFVLREYKKFNGGHF